MLNAFKHGVILAAFAATTTAYAGETVTKEVVAPPPEKIVSGWISADFNTHFISYGADVWGGGQSWRKPTFNPSGELSIKLPLDGLSLLGGMWMDINHNGPSSFGEPLQEIDIWTGFAYTNGPISAKLLYQAWFYGGTTEQILDLTLSYDCLLKPTLVIHGRMDPGAAEGGGGSAGVFFVPGISHPFELGPVTVTPSLNVGFCTDDYHGGDGGYGYLALGLNASVPLPFLPGDWSFHAGVTYYNTNEDVIPANVDNNFVTGNAGITLAF